MWSMYPTLSFGLIILGAAYQLFNYFEKINMFRFPGPIFFNVTMDVNEELPTDKIEMDLEVKFGL